MTCPKVKNNAWKSLKKMNRKQLRIATQILTGHTTLRYHLFKMGIEPSPICQNCDEAPETVEHFLKSCPRYSRLRHGVFGNFTLDKELHEYKIFDIMKFVKRSKRLAIE